MWNWGRLRKWKDPLVVLSPLLPWIWRNELLKGAVGLVRRSQVRAGVGAVLRAGSPRLKAV